MDSMSLKELGEKFLIGKHNMGKAERDNNNITTILGTLNSDGSTPTPIKIDPTTHELKIDDDTTGSDNSGDIADRDDNMVTVMLGVSSADGATPTALYADSSGNLLIDST